MSIEIDYGTVNAAATVWRGQAEQLRGATASLDEIDTAGSVGPAAAGALALYVDHWSERLRGMTTTSDAHADALERAAAHLLLSDDVATDEISGLLAWQV